MHEEDGTHEGTGLSSDDLDHQATALRGLQADGQRPSFPPPQLVEGDHTPAEMARAQAEALRRARFSR